LWYYKHFFFTFIIVYKHIYFQTTPELKESEQTEIYEAVKSAIDIGYRHFDCAAYYNNEKSVGKSISEKIKKGIIKREDIYITSKVNNNTLLYIFIIII